MHARHDAKQPPTPSSKVDTTTLRAHARACHASPRSPGPFDTSLDFPTHDGNTPHTLEEIGVTFGVTRERVRQIEAEALKKLRGPATTRGMRTALEP